MEAIIKTGGKQYSVAKGTKLNIEKLEGKVGDLVTFDQVLMVSGDSVKIGTPWVTGAKVSAKILSQGKGEKVTIYKYKRRKGYHKKQGHRQLQTRIEIQEIQV